MPNRDSLAAMHEIAQKSNNLPQRVLVGTGGGLGAAHWRHRALESGEVVPPDHVITYHLHGSTQVQRRERGRLTANGSRLRTVALIEAQSCTQWLIGGEMDVLHLYLPDALLQQAAGSPSGSRPIRLRHFFGEQDHWLEGLFKMVWCEMEASAGEPVPALLLDEIGLSLARHMLRRYAAASTLPQPARTTGGMRPAALRRVLALMQDDPQPNHRITDLARMVAMSEDHFIRAFRQSVGLTPYRYLLQCRLSEARRLLQHAPELSVAQVSTACGFGSARHFATMFRRHAGTTPSAWRQQFGNG